MKEYESDPVKYKQYIKVEKLHIPIGPNHLNSWKGKLFTKTEIHKGNG